MHFWSYHYWKPESFCSEMFLETLLEIRRWLETAQHNDACLQDFVWWKCIYLKKNSFSLNLVHLKIMWKDYLDNVVWQDWKDDFFLFVPKLTFLENWQKKVMHWYYLTFEKRNTRQNLVKSHLWAIRKRRP